MNDTNQAEMGQLYLRFLNRQEEAEKAVVPSQQTESLNDAVLSGHQIIERLALFGAALNANFTAIQKKLADLEATHPDLLKQFDEHVGSLVGLRDTFVAFYADEAAFCATFERMVRDRMLNEAGVDPNDQEAVMAFLLKAGKALTPPALNPASN